MKLLFRSLAAGALCAAALAAGPALAAKDVTLAVASTFTTTDPYDANDTLSQAMAKSFYEGLFGFDKDMTFHPVGTGPFKFVEWKATDYLKVAKFDGYWKKGYPKVDTITWKPVIDSNSRAAVMQTGEAQFTYPVPYEMAETLKAKPEL